MELAETERHQLNPNVQTQMSSFRVGYARITLRGYTSLRLNMAGIVSNMISMSSSKFQFSM